MMEDADADALEQEADEQPKARAKPKKRAKAAKPSMEEMIAAAVGAMGAQLVGVLRSEMSAMAPRSDDGEPVRVRRPPRQLTAEEMRERQLHWWNELQPLLRSAWLMTTRGTANEDSMGTLVRAMSQAYEQSQRNILGQEPTTAMPPPYAPGYADPGTGKMPRVGHGGMGG